MKCQEYGNNGERRNKARKDPGDVLMGGEGSRQGVDRREESRRRVNRREGSRRHIDGRERV